jgi:formate dehydrogenase gamma subunit
MSSSFGRFARRTTTACLLAVVAVTSPGEAQHPNITLLDADGNIINPVTGENAGVAFSTEQTCGLCHDYDTITKGYHFQMGWEVVSDDYGVASGQPWSLSNGFLGRWYPYAFRQLAKKHNTTADHIDLTVYDFVGFSSPGRDEPPCGACHPGGGGLEHDRDGKRYDQQLAGHPELAAEFDGDYYRSRWDKSGVVEADCLLCHLEGYSFSDRTDQLTQGNYRWAVVAGSRFGIVDGSVRQGDTPTVRYETRLFNIDGTISVELSSPPPDANCMYCHGTSDVKKRGFSWNDIYNPDIHNQRGVACTSCHPADINHQIAKGYEPEFTAAPEYDNTMKRCADCHGVGYLGAPIPQHPSIRPSHLEIVACESCHTPELGRVAAQGVDATTGQLVFTYQPAGAKAAGDKGIWKPDYERHGSPRISPVNSVLAIWWGNRTDDGVVHPLFLREHEAAWRLFEDAVTDDNGDGHKEVNREPEILAGLKAFTTSLQGNERFDEIHPVLVKGESSYELDGSGNLLERPLAGTPLAAESRVDFSINHNVAPTRWALGAGGCLDCHAAKEHFFKGERVVDLSGPAGPPEVRSNGWFFGCKPWAFAINSFHQRIVDPYFGPLLMLVVFLIVLHYHSYGPKRITFDPYSDEIRRFAFSERAVHLFRLIAFVILAVSGLILAFNLFLWQQLVFGSPQRLHDFHVAAGVVFIITTLGGIVLWFRDAMFASYDRDWVKEAGGYLGYKGNVPAGRFNAGQKMFYWYTAFFGLLLATTGLILVFKSAFSLPTICITSTVHGISGFFIIAGVVAHAYLGTVANPGTWRVLVDGSVTREWARHHHPNWYRALLASGKISPDESEDPTADGAQDVGDPVAPRQT